MRVVSGADAGAGDPSLQVDWWLRRPEVSLLMQGSSGLQGELKDIINEARRLGPSCVPVAVARLRQAKTNDEKSASMSLVAYLFRQHTVDNAQRRNALGVVINELQRTPMDEILHTTNLALQFLSFHGEEADLSKVSPYVKHSNGYIRNEAVSACEMISERAKLAKEAHPISSSENITTPVNAATDDAPTDASAPKQDDVRSSVPVTNHADRWIMGGIVSVLVLFLWGYSIRNRP